MKLKLTEQQVKRLVQNLNEQEFDVAKETPGLARLGKFMSGGGQDFDNNDDDSESSVEPEFSDKIPGGEEMMHPLGRRGNITSKYGRRTSKVGSKNHKGIDIGVKSNSPVYAPLDGVVTAARNSEPNPCGGFIKIDHDNLITKYCHLSRISVRQGQQVKKGQVIGYSGGGPNDPMPGSSTGPHLHYEILDKSGIAQNPLDIQHNLA
jgi:murein DD-endopeptidase MepM/ murein hydrolase activator NlpD